MCAKIDIRRRRRKIFDDVAAAEKYLTKSPPSSDFLRRSFSPKLHLNTVTVRKNKNWDNN